MEIEKSKKQRKGIASLMIKKLFIIVFTFSLLTSVRVAADTSDNLRIFTIINYAIIVALDRNILIAEVDIDTIGTSGTDTYYLGVVEMDLFSTHAMDSYLLITSEKGERYARKALNSR